MFGKSIQIVAGFFGFILFLIGLRWLIDPTGAAASLGMDLLAGAGRSTQIGDFAAFFIVCGGLVLLGLATRNASLLVAPAALVGAAAVFRTVAWLLHDAAFSPEAIVPELLMCAVFLLARRQIAAKPSGL